MKRRDNWKLPAFISAQSLQAFFMTGSAVVALSLTFSLTAAAKDPSDEGYMIRMLVCEGESAKMELYLPQSIVFGKTPLAEALAHPTIGYYAARPQRREQRQIARASKGFDGGRRESGDRKPIHARLAANPYSGERRYGRF